MLSGCGIPGSVVQESQFLFPFDPPLQRQRLSARKGILQLVDKGGVGEGVLPLLVVGINIHQTLQQSNPYRHLVGPGHELLL